MPIESSFRFSSGIQPGNREGPGIAHPREGEGTGGKAWGTTLGRARQHWLFRGRLLGIRGVRELPPAASGLEIRARRINARGRRIEDRGRLGAPEVLAAMRHFGLDRFARDGTFDEHDAAVDARHRRPAVGELANRELHYAVFARS